MLLLFVVFGVVVLLLAFRCYLSDCFVLLCFMRVLLLLRRCCFLRVGVVCVMCFVSV